MTTRFISIRHSELVSESFKSPSTGADDNIFYFHLNLTSHFLGTFGKHCAQPLIFKPDRAE